MRLTFSTDDGDVFSIDVEPATDWSTVAALVEANCGVPVASQEYAYNGQRVTPPPGQTIAALGLKDDDMVYVRRAAAGAGSAGSASAARPTTGKGGKRKLLSLPAAAPKIDPGVYSSLTWDTLPPEATPKEMYDILQVSATNVNVCVTLANINAQLGNRAADQCLAFCADVFTTITCPVAHHLP